MQDCDSRVFGFSVEGALLILIILLQETQIYILPQKMRSCSRHARSFHLG